MDIRIDGVPYLTAQDARQILGHKDLSTIHHMVKAGRLKFIKIGNTLFLDEADIRRKAVDPERKPGRPQGKITSS